MAYTKTEWKARKGVNLTRFKKYNETATTVVLENAPESVSEPGTPFDVNNMNHIEDGIYEAHEAIAAEEQARIQGDDAIRGDLGEHNTDDEAHPDIRQALLDGLSGHNTDDEAHPDIRQSIGELEESDQAIYEAVAMEAATREEADQTINTILNNLVGLPQWDSSNYILTFTARNGSRLVIDLPIEALAKDIDYDSATKEIIITKHDDTEIRVNVSDLVDVYEGSKGTNIQVTVDSGNIIRAVLLAGSVTENELSSILLQKLNNKLDSDHNTDAEAHPDIRQSIEQLEEKVNVLEPEGLEEVLQTIRELREKYEYYPGYLYTQFPGGYTPAELIDKGVFPEDSQWDVWSHRAELYELVPAADYPSAALTAYASGQNVAANAYRIYQLAGDDRQIWKANKAISSTPAQIDPLNWALLPGIVRVRRCDLHSDIWTDNDLEIGDEVTYNGTDYRVSGILVLGGKYLAGEGGNRPTFINDGTAGDRIRNIYGFTQPGIQNGGNLLFSRIPTTGAFDTEVKNENFANATSSIYLREGCNLRLDASRVVPVGSENAPRTLSVRYWRRVS